MLPFAHCRQQIIVPCTVLYICTFIATSMYPILYTKQTRMTVRISESYNPLRPSHASHLPTT